MPADPPGGTLSGPSGTQISDRSRSPGVGHAAGRRAGADALDQPRDSADLYQLCLQHGIAPYLVFPVAAAVRRMQLFDLRLQLLTSASHLLPLVYQDGPGPDLPAPPAESDTEGTSSPAADDSSRSPLASAPALPELKSVRVAVATFQGPTRYYSLWTQDGEDLAGFLVRAEILINDDASFLILLPVDPQPSLPQLSLLLCPRWWALVGILPCMVQGPCAASQPFMLVAHQDQTVQDCLPQDILPATGSAIVAVSPRDDSERVVLQLEQQITEHLSSASLLHVVPLYEPDWEDLPAQRHLTSLEHVPRAEAEAVGPAAAPRLALFLGFGFDQFLLTLEFGSVAQFVSEAFGVPREHVYILRQWPCFDQLTVAGRSVTHCFGYRNLGDMGRRFVGTGLFLDPRPLGRPVCFREVGSPLLSPSQICLWLQVTTPNGYAPFCAGGSLPGSAAHSFLVNHGDTILVWIDCIQPPPSIASPVNDRDSAQSTTDAFDSDGDTRPDSASLPRPSATAAAVSRNRRSRSPRCHRNGTPVSGALAAMWSDSTCDTTATSTCPCRLTPDCAGPASVLEESGPPGPTFAPAAATCPLFGKRGPPVSGLSVPELPCAAPTATTGQKVLSSGAALEHLHASGSHLLASLQVAADGPMCPASAEGSVAGLEAEPLAIAAPPLPRPLPTPERPYICPMCADVGADSLRTLLQLSPRALRESWLRQLDGLTAPAVKILSLEALLPKTASQRSALEIADILQQRAQCQPDLPEDWLDADLQPVMLSEHATEALRWRLRDVLTAWDVPGMGLVTSVLIFTDGSFKPASNGGLRQCAWAFSVWLQGDVGERYLGHSAYSSVPPHTAYWLGEEEESSSTAEQLALAWALVWALDRGVAFHAPIIFVYDNVSAGGGAFGASLPPGTNSALQTSRLSAVTASLRQCLETRTQVLHRHVKSHSGVLENEIVDVLAKNASWLRAWGLLSAACQVGRHFSQPTLYTNGHGWLWIEGGTCQPFMPCRRNRHDSSHHCNLPPHRQDGCSPLSHRVASLK